MSETVLAEAALRSLALRTADYHRLAASKPTTAGGRHWANYRDTRNGNALTDCVAVAESFAVARLLALRPTISEQDVSSWEKRRKAWLKHGGVDLCSYGNWSALRGYVEVRNALQHGLGRLTEHQLENRRSEIMDQIKAAAVHLNGPNVMLNDRDPIACAGVCAGFVHFLDTAAPLA